MLPNVLRPNATDHVPVLAEEVREALAVQPGETVVDATFGAGGHAEILAADLRGKGKLIAIDRDPSARAYFDRFRRQTAVQGRFLRGEFSVVLEQLASNGVRADAVLFDLGVSSMQIDRPERGFSYAADAPLDMRMDPNAELSARELVLPAALELLRPGGRLAVISFHSLEDRIVKRFLRKQEHGCTCPPDFPVCVCGQEPVLRAISRRAIRPSAPEIAANPRAASARLRAAVKVQEDQWPAGATPPLRFRP